MNFETVRYLAFFVICIIYFLLRSKEIIKIKNRLIDIIVFILSFIILFFIPFEGKFLNFDSLEKAFDYSYPGNEIDEKLIFEDYAIVIYKDRDGEKRVTYFLRGNNLWNFDNPNSLKLNKKIGYVYDFVITINEIKERDKVFVVVSCFRFIDEEVPEIKDSLGSNFEMIEEKIENVIYYEFRTTISFNENYYISINGEDKLLPTSIFMKELENY